MIATFSGKPVFGQVALPVQDEGLVETNHMRETSNRNRNRSSFDTCLLRHPITEDGAEILSADEQGQGGLCHNADEALQSADNQSTPCPGHGKVKRSQRLSMRVGISETTRSSPWRFGFIRTPHLAAGITFPATLRVQGSFLSTSSQGTPSFDQWLAGLIDGNGSLILDEDGYGSLEISMDIRDKAALYRVKQRFGGSISTYGGGKIARYRLHHSQGILDLLQAVSRRDT